MRVLVCGGRGYSDIDRVYAVLDGIHYRTPITTIIEGGAKGADYLACRWSAARGLDSHARFSADWALHGKAAGPMRNQKMLDEGKPDLVVAFPGGRGTADMVSRAKAADVKVVEVSATQAIGMSPEEWEREKAMARAAMTPEIEEEIAKIWRRP